MVDICPLMILQNLNTKKQKNKEKNVDVLGIEGVLKCSRSFQEKLRLGQAM